MTRIHLHWADNPGGTAAHVCWQDWDRHSHQWHPAQMSHNSLSTCTCKQFLSQMFVFRLMQTCTTWCYVQQTEKWIKIKRPQSWIKLLASMNMYTLYWQQCRLWLTCSCREASTDFVSCMANRGRWQSLDWCMTCTAISGINPTNDRIRRLTVCWDEVCSLS